MAVTRKKACKRWLGAFGQQLFIGVDRRDLAIVLREPGDDRAGLQRLGTE